MTSARTLIRAAVTAGLLSLPAAAFAANSQGGNSQGGDAQDGNAQGGSNGNRYASVPELDPAAIGIVTVAVAGGIAFLARRRRA